MLATSRPAVPPHALPTRPVRGEQDDARVRSLAPPAWIPVLRSMSIGPHRKGASAVAFGPGDYGPGAKGLSWPAVPGPADRAGRAEAHVHTNFWGVYALLHTASNRVQANQYHWILVTCGKCHTGLPAPWLVLSVAGKKSLKM